MNGMYAAALAALAGAGFKSKSHAATLAVLESVYVKGLKSLAVRDIFSLTKARSLSKEIINKIIRVKSRPVRFADFIRFIKPI